MFILIAVYLNLYSRHKNYLLNKINRKILKLIKGLYKMFKDFLYN